MTDKLHYLRIPNGMGARAEMVRMAYVLAKRPYVDVFHDFANAGQAVGGKNPYKQFPFVETDSGEIIYQTLAIMHHAGGWPTGQALTKALMVAMGAYDLYQAFAGFSADDAAAKKKFEERRVPQYMGALGEIYAKTNFAAGDTPCFADCIAHEAIAWTVRRNEVAKRTFEANKSLVDFVARFRGVPAIKEFMARQAAAREKDNAV